MRQVMEMPETSGDLCSVWVQRETGLFILPKLQWKWSRFQATVCCLEKLWDCAEVHAGWWINTRTHTHTQTEEYLKSLALGNQIITKTLLLLPADWRKKDAGKQQINR